VSDTAGCASFDLIMTTFGITEARKRLSELIDRALAGEQIIITRRGHPVVELKPVAMALRGKASANEN
jgi:prevent-host-death family protein